MTVLRDTYVNTMLRTTAFLLLLLTCACKQTPSDPATTAAQAAEKEKAATSNVVSAQVITIRSELNAAKESMNGIFTTAESMRAGTGKEKSAADSEVIDAVAEKSAAILGAMNIMDGSLSAVEQRFNDGTLDQKQALEMLTKLQASVKSFEADVKGYQAGLNSVTSAKSEKEKK